MPLTKDQHGDLTTRLEMLMGEFAPASDRNAGVEKLRAILARIPIAEEPAVEEPPRPNTDPSALREDGPTLEEFVAAGYLAEHYPPAGHAERPSDGLTALRAAQAAAAESTTHA